MKHPPVAQGAYSICEQKGSYKSLERKVWEVNNIFCSDITPFLTLAWASPTIRYEKQIQHGLLCFTKIMTKRTFLAFLSYHSPEERLILKF